MCLVCNLTLCIYSPGVSSVFVESSVFVPVVMVSVPGFCVSVSSVGFHFVHFSVLLLHCNAVSLSLAPFLSLSLSPPSSTSAHSNSKLTTGEPRVWPCSLSLRVNCVCGVGILPLRLEEAWRRRLGTSKHRLCTGVRAIPHQQMQWHTHTDTHTYRASRYISPLTTQMLTNSPTPAITQIILHNQLITIYNIKMNRYISY